MPNSYQPTRPQDREPPRASSPPADTPSGQSGYQTLAEATANFQVEYIEAAIKQSSKNISQAASKLGLHRSNLYRKMRQLGMNNNQ